MSGTQTFIVILVAFAVVLGLLAWTIVALRSRPPTHDIDTAAEFALGEIFSFKLSLSAAEKGRAANAIGEAEAAKEGGKSASDAAQRVREQISALDQIRLTRVLWVDDKPDNNVYESVALMRLGFLITTATSNNAARRYLAELEFDLIITDIGREAIKDDGTVLIHELNSEMPQLPVVVYTGDADATRTDLRNAGASAVEDEPGALLDRVIALTTTTK